MILFLLLGILTGTITGLIPGIHSNNISLILLMSPLFGANAIVFTLSMCITQSFVDFIPAIYLGAPNTDTFEGVLPGHKLFLNGEGLQAIVLTVFGGIISLLASLLFLNFFIIFITESWEFIKYSIPIILLFVLCIIILNEKKLKKKLFIIFVIISAGTQGLFFTNQIFPLIVGYFGLPTIIYSLNKLPQLKKQTKEIIIEKKLWVEGIIGIIGGAIVSLLPGIGSNLAAAIIRLFRTKIKTNNYLVLLGSINTSAFFFSFSILFFLNKMRNGAMIVLSEQIFFISEEYFIGIGTMLIAGGFGGLITIYLAKKASDFFSENKTKLFSIISICVMITSVILFNGLNGIIALFFSGNLGFFVVLNKLNRSSCLSSLIIPTMLFYVFTIY